MTISDKSWKQYIDDLRKISDKAAELMTRYLETHDYNSKEGRQEAIEYGYALAVKYGEGAAEKACQMYDAVSSTAKKRIPAAEPAETATIAEVGKAINGTLKFSKRPDVVGQSIGRLVKRTGVDTTMKNALRDGAEWAWIPNGDTCAFCLTLASRGWQRASKKAIKNGHAEHIHANCDCTYAIRFDGRSTVEGYDPDALLEIYDSAEGYGSKNKINYMRRKKYAENKDAINAQKRSSYAERKILDTGMYRKGENSGEFIDLPERMSKKHIRDVAKEFNISLKHVKINIDKDVEKLKKNFIYTGRADHKTIGVIEFFPKAFMSKEELVRTLFHERIHVMQFREFGSEYVQNNRRYFEKLASDAEEEFIANAKKAGLL